MVSVDVKHHVYLQQVEGTKMKIKLWGGMGGEGGGGLVKHRVFSEDVLVGTEIPGGGPGLARLCRTLLTLSPPE